MEIALKIIEIRKWRNGYLHELARAALTGGDIWEYSDLTEEEFHKYLAGTWKKGRI